MFNDEFENGLIKLNNMKHPKAIWLLDEGITIYGKSKPKYLRRKDGSIFIYRLSPLTGKEFSQFEKDMKNYPDLKYYIKHIEKKNKYLLKYIGNKIKLNFYEKYNNISYDDIIEKKYYRGRTIGFFIISAIFFDTSLWNRNNIYKKQIILPKKLCYYLDNKIISDNYDIEWNKPEICGYKEIYILDIKKLDNIKKNEYKETDICLVDHVNKYRIFEVKHKPYWVMGSKIDLDGYRIGKCDSILTINNSYINMILSSIVVDPSISIDNNKTWTLFDIKNGVLNYKYAHAGAIDIPIPISCKFRVLFDISEMKKAIRVIFTKFIKWSNQNNINIYGKIYNFIFDKGQCGKEFDFVIQDENQTNYEKLFVIIGEIYAEFNINEIYPPQGCEMLYPQVYVKYYEDVSEYNGYDKKSFEKNFDRLKLEYIAKEYNIGGKKYILSYRMDRFDTIIFDSDQILLKQNLYTFYKTNKLQTFMYEPWEDAIKQNIQNIDELYSTTDKNDFIKQLYSLDVILNNEGLPNYIK